MTIFNPEPVSVETEFGILHMKVWNDEEVSFRSEQTLNVGNVDVELDLALIYQIKENHWLPVSGNQIQVGPNRYIQRKNPVNELRQLNEVLIAICEGLSKKLLWEAAINFHTGSIIHNMDHLAFSISEIQNELEVVKQHSENIRRFMKLTEHFRDRLSNLQKETTHEETK